MCKFYRPQHNRKGGMDPVELNFEGLEMKKWNIPTDRAQRKDRKKWVSFPVIMFTPQVIVIKMSKMTHFLYFRLIPPKSQSQYFDKIFICIWKILFSSLRKCYGLLNSELPLARYQPLKIQSFIIFLLTQHFFDISNLDIW